MLGRLGVLLAALALIAAAPQTPRSIIAGVYRNIIAANEGRAQEVTPPESLYTPRLRALIAAARKAAAGEAPCGLDFVTWINGQDDDIRAVGITEQPGPGRDAETVVARFSSLQEHSELHFAFRRIAGRWRIDEVTSVVGTTWVFSKLLQCQG
jgi:hypothetical protein